jgi:Protein of unknown function (DUF4079)
MGMCLLKVVNRWQQVVQFLKTNRWATYLTHKINSYRPCTQAYAAYLGYSTRIQRTKVENGEGAGLVRENSRRELTGRTHYKLASALLCATVGGALLGMGNTFLRTGRLFPGPHLYLGLCKQWQGRSSARERTGPTALLTDAVAAFVV